MGEFNSSARVVRPTFDELVASARSAKFLGWVLPPNVDCGRVAERAVSMKGSIGYDYKDLVGKIEGAEAAPLSETEIAFVTEEARKRHDAEALASIAEWYEEKENARQYLALAHEAAELGSPRANFWLGHDYKSGEHIARDYEKAYEYFQKAKDHEWDESPIDPEDFMDIESNDGEITAGDLAAKGDWEWWMFVLCKHPTRALKCGMADWCMEKGEVDKALELCAESAEVGFPYATRLMLEHYLPHPLRVPIWGKWSQNGVANVEKAKYWYRKAEQAGEDVKEYAGQLGLVSEYVRQLIEQAKDGGDCEAVAKLVLAYLNGNGCPRDLERAFSYAEKLLFQDEDYGVFSELREAAVNDPEVKRRYNLLMRKANDIEKSV